MGDRICLAAKTELMLFQVAKRGDMAGVGRGILVFDLESCVKANK
jgi:hypothetical protein